MTGCRRLAFAAIAFAVIAIVGLLLFVGCSSGPEDPPKPPRPIQCVVVHYRDSDGRSYETFSGARCWTTEDGRSYEIWQHASWPDPPDVLIPIDRVDYVTNGPCQ